MRSARWRAAFVAWALGAAGPPTVLAKDYTFDMRTSFKGTILVSRAPDAPFVSSERDSATSFWRARFAPQARFGDRLSLGAAYEQRYRVSSGAGTAAGLGILPPETDAPYRIRQLDWSISQTEGFSWRHEIDRAYLAVHSNPLDLTVGRQAIGWGRGVVFGAVDLFSPFTPLEVDREWRRGVDAVRADIKLTSRASLDVVGAFGETLDGSAFAARVRGYRGNVDVELLGGVRARDVLAGVTSSAAVGDAEIHGELAFFRAPEPLPAGGLGSEGRGAIKAVAGGSYRFAIGNGILLFTEYHYSGFGAKSPQEILPLLANPSFLERYLRGDTQILVRHGLAVLATYEFSTEHQLDLQCLLSPLDGSGIVVPSLTWILDDRLSLLASGYLPYGPPPDGPTLESVYGAAAISGLFQVRIYF